MCAKCFYCFFSISEFLSVSLIVGYTSGSFNFLSLFAFASAENRLNSKIIVNRFRYSLWLYALRNKSIEGLCIEMYITRMGLDTDIRIQIQMVDEVVH